MKYEQPYGVSDPNASYINGNPSTGTMGSIPPAASIENPQREIVNLITDAGGTPVDADLHQLAKGVQSGKLVYAVDFGTANVYSIVVTPPLTAYAAGQRWAVKIGNTNNGPSSLNISGLGGRQIIYPGGAQLRGGEMVTNEVVTLIDDGTNLQLQNVGASPVGGKLTANLDYYVNAATGSDTLYDGLTPTVSGSHGPFATVQRAISAAFQWNQNGFTVNIHVATGVYPPFVCTAINGAGQIIITGDLTTPSNVLIHATTGEAIWVQASNYGIKGLKVQADANGATPHLGVGIRVNGATVSLGNIDFGSCFFAHLFCSSSSLAVFSGVESGEPSAYYVVSGDTPVHLYAGANSYIHLAQTGLITLGARSIGIWAKADTLGVIDDIYSSPQSIGGVVTGQKYNGALNAVINSFGNGVNYFPGTIPGTVTTGAQYG